MAPCFQFAREQDDKVMWILFLGKTKWCKKGEVSTPTCTAGTAIHPRDQCKLPKNTQHKAEDWERGTCYGNVIHKSRPWSELSPGQQSSTTRKEPWLSGQGDVCFGNEIPGGRNVPDLLPAGFCWSRKADMLPGPVPSPQLQCRLSEDDKNQQQGRSWAGLFGDFLAYVQDGLEECILVDYWELKEIHGIYKPLSSSENLSDYGWVLPSWEFPTAMSSITKASGPLPMRI